MAITGGCLCGKVRFTIEADAPIAARVCWCRVCQYIGAGSGTANAVFPKDKIAVTGELAGYDSVAESGNHMRRSFCPVMRHAAVQRGGRTAASRRGAHRRA